VKDAGRHECGPGRYGGGGHALSSEGCDASEDGTGRGTPLCVQLFNPHRTLQKDGTVTEGFKPDDISDAMHGPTGNKEPLLAFTQNQRNEVRDLKDVAGTCEAEPGSHQRTLLCFQTRIARNGRGQPKETADALTSSEGGTHADSKPHVFGGSMVRRLTPTECERLQSFPDDWTGIGGMKDTCRYRMIGNAVTVNVAEWLGRRIAAATGLPS
jgi:DNA (cytosine-5)-methyltransferase 1